jgi:hypothetical protein
MKQERRGRAGDTAGRWRAALMAAAGLAVAGGLAVAPAGAATAGVGSGAARAATLYVTSVNSARWCR